MAALLHQTRDAIAKLTAAGWTQGEYRVRTPQKSNGDYDRTYITLWGTAEKRTGTVDALVDAGLTVHRYLLDGGAVSIHVEDHYHADGRGRLWETDYRAGADATPRRVR